MKFTRIAAMALTLLVTGLAVGEANAQAPAVSFQAANVDDAARVAYAAAPKGWSDVRAIGAGLVIIGAGLGIGMLTRSAVESMARQPEIAGQVQTAMIISAALIEGVSFFALIVIGFILAAY